jgi:hypothetical protein
MIDQTKINALQIKPLDEGYPEINEEYIRRLEAVLKGPIPETYRQFLSLQKRVTMPSVTASVTCVDGEDTTVELFFGVDPDGTYDLIGNYESYEGRVPPTLLPIAEDGFGNLICLGIAAADRGRVYFWDHEAELGPDAPHRRNLHEIAESFEGLIDSLQVDDEELPV